MDAVAEVLRSGRVNQWTGPYVDEFTTSFAARMGGNYGIALANGTLALELPLRGGRTVDFTPVHGTIEADLLRRDFTINAIALPVAGGEHLDPCGGREDLQLREVRAVSESVFEDDPLRLVRAVRLADELDFTIAPMTRRLIVDHAALRWRVPPIAEEPRPTEEAEATPVVREQR